MIEIQCTSCHTRYRIDELVLPEGTPTFKCSRCGHVFTFEPRKHEAGAAPASPTEPPSASPKRGPQSGFKPRPEASQPRAGATSSKPQDQPPPQAKKPDDEAPAKKEAASAEPHDDDPLSKPFNDDREDNPLGENLSFDFRDDPVDAIEEPLESRDLPDDNDQWQVGDTEPEPPPVKPKPEPEAIRPREPLEEIIPAAAKKSRRTDDVDEFVRPEKAPIYNRGLIRSSRFFMGLFLLVAIGYGLLTFLIHSAPEAATEILSQMPLVGQRFVLPITPAQLVALRNVTSEYQRTKDNRTTLVVAGLAENVGTGPLRVVKIAVRLRDSAQKEVGHKDVYCGDNLSEKMIGEMTPHELDFFQNLAPPKTFRLDPSQTCKFVLAFINPPAGVDRFDISVAEAVPTANQGVDDGGL